MAGVGGDDDDVASSYYSLSALNRSGIVRRYYLAVDQTDFFDLLKSGNVLRVPAIVQRKMKP